MTKVKIPFEEKRGLVERKSGRKGKAYLNERRHGYISSDSVVSAER